MSSHTYHRTRDKALIETFNRADETGSDVFTEIGREIYGGDFQKSDPRRGLVKNVIYGKLYGSGVKKMSESAGVALEVMTGVNTSLEAKYPGIKQYQRDMESGINARKAVEGKTYIKTVVTGRHIPVDEDKVYTGLNYTIQSTAAEVFKTNLVKLDAAGLSDYMLVPVHDEIVMSVPPKDVKDVSVVLQEGMTTTEGWAVPLTSGVDGPYKRWGDKYAEDH